MFPWDTVSPWVHLGCDSFSEFHCLWWSSLFWSQCFIEYSSFVNRFSAEICLLLFSCLDWSRNSPRKTTELSVIRSYLIRGKYFCCAFSQFVYHCWSPGRGGVITLFHCEGILSSWCSHSALGRKWKVYCTHLMAECPHKLLGILHRRLASSLLFFDLLNICLNMNSWLVIFNITSYIQYSIFFKIHTCSLVIRTS